MGGGTKNKTKGKSQQDQCNNDNLSENEDDNVTASNQAKQEDMDAIQANIITEIKAIRTDMKKEHSETLGVLKKELTDFREEINQKLSFIGIELQEITERVGEAEQRVGAVEEQSAEISELLSHTLEIQQSMQAQLTDLEARSRRNNIRIHGIPEGSEGEYIQDYVEKFIRSQLSLSEPRLGIQRCHRSLGSRPPEGSSPRSIVIYFQEYKTKETVLRAAWKKREITVEGKRVFFEQDFPTEILKKRKAYAGIRKILKENGLRFQTLYPAKLKVFFSTGPVFYNDAAEATDDLKKRGYTLDSSRAAAMGPEPASASRPAATTGPRQPPWEKAGARPRRDHLRHIQEKLKTFRRNTDAT